MGDLGNMVNLERLGKCPHCHMDGLVRWETNPQFDVCRDCGTMVRVPDYMTPFLEAAAREPKLAIKRRRRK